MSNSTQSPLKNFCYKQTDYLQWLKEFATALDCKVKDNSVILTEAAGKGMSSAFLLEKGCTACVNDYYLNDDYLFTRKPSENFGLIIYLYYFQTASPIQYDLDDLSVLMNN